MHRGATGKLISAAKSLYSKPIARNPNNGFDIGYLSANQDTEVFPENWPAVQIFLSMDTQWNAGVNGRIGLNYLVLLALIDRVELSKEDAKQMFDDVRVLERAALEEINKETS